MARETWGSIRKLASGRYQARYRADNGEMCTAPHTFDRKADARAWLSAKRTDLRRGLDIDDRANRKPLSHWWPALQDDAARRLKPSTVKYYDELWREHVQPRFGRTAVGRVKASDIDKWLGQMLDAGTSPSRIRGALGVLSRLLDAAVRDRAITANPAASRSVRVPSSRPVERPVLTPAEIAELHDAATEPLAVLVSVLAWGGLRIGEALGLQRQDIDVDAGTVTVARSVSEINGVVHVTDPKNGRSRVVTLPASVVGEIRSHLKHVAIHPGAWLFPSRNGKPKRYTNFRRDQWLPMLRRVNTARAERGGDQLAVMPHDLRATCASLLIDAGASPKDVQQHLGHADITTTMNLYARVRPGRAEDLAARMDQMLAGAAE